MTEAPIATTAYGRVRAVTENGIHVFKEIPYGATTAGAARFQAPTPPTAWDGVRDALAYPPMAPQAPITLGGLFARSLLSALEIPPSNATKLATLPMDDMVSGMAKVARGPDRAIWRPVADGKVLPGGPW
jgi:para-nitrobenzyl esterase